MWPTFLWVSKLCLKLKVEEHQPFSKLPYAREFSHIWFQTCHFRFRWSFGVLKNHPFFRKSHKPFSRCKVGNIFFVSGTRYGVIDGRMDVFDSAPTLSLRGPGLINLQTRPMAELSGRDRTDGNQKCPLNFFVFI